MLQNVDQMRADQLAHAGMAEPAMTLQANMQTILADYLDATRLSRAALSRRAGVGEGIVGKILREPSYAPSAGIIAALSEAVGAALPSPFAPFSRTWAQVREDLRAADSTDRRISRINWLMRSANWVTETRIADRREVVAFFKSHVAATFNLAASSFASYQSDLLSCLPKPSGRIRGIRDVVGSLRTLYDAIGQDEKFRDYHLHSGAFFAWMDERGLSPRDLVPEALSLYYPDRLATENKSEGGTRVHVQRIAALTRRLAEHPNYSNYAADLVQWLWEEFRVSVSAATVGRELRALGFRKLSARPRHYAQDPEAAEAFKKLSRSAWRQSGMHIRASA